jgi:hypothetical protein
MARNVPIPEREINQTRVAKCAFELCACAAEPGSEYCCNYCEAAALEKEVEIQCDCKHAPCELTQKEPLGHM